MKRKWMIPLLTGIFAASLIIGITTAYFSDSAAVSPDITAGTVVIDLSESFNPPTNWQAGETTPKGILIKNMGNKRAYIRVRVAGVWQKDGADTALDINNVQVTNNSSDWVLSGGYYYYKHVLNAGATTSPLNLSVKLLSKDEKYDGHTFMLKAYSQAVQATNGAYMDVWGLSSLPPEVEILSLP